MAPRITAESASQRHLPVVVPGGTGNAWANPQPAETARQLILEGGFAVDNGRDRHLEARVGALGFDDLGAYLQVRCDACHSVPRIAAELGVGDWQVQAALARRAVQLPPRAQRLAAQRRRYTEERIAARVAELSFADVQAYLLDRVVERSWLPDRGSGGVGGASADGAAAAASLRDPPGAAQPCRASGGRCGASGAGGVVAGSSGRAAGRTWVRGSGRLPAGAPCGAGLVGEADAGRASRWPSLAGCRAGPAGAAAMTWSRSRRSCPGARVWIPVQGSNG
jgi:hypothetical protein